jgi:hypothetical protein
MAVVHSPAGERVLSVVSPPAAFHAVVTWISYASDGGALGASVYIVSCGDRETARPGQLTENWTHFSFSNSVASLIGNAFPPFTPVPCPSGPNADRFAPGLVSHQLLNSSSASATADLPSAFGPVVSPAVLSPVNTAGIPCVRI